VLDKFEHQNMKLIPWSLGGTMKS